MKVRAAYVYVRLLFALELVLLVASLLMNFVVFIGRSNHAGLGTALFRAAVFLGLPVFAFIKESLRWPDQIKSCPKWMWKSALFLGAYTLLSLFLEAIILRDNFLTKQSLMLYAFPLGFDAIFICILYSVLYVGYLEESEIVRRAQHSVIFIVFIAIMFIAADYLPYPKQMAHW
jgi:hypothetical protein